MEFAKKLYIMTGRGEEKGAVTVERNAFGTFAEVSVYNLKHCAAPRYFAFISDTVKVFPMRTKGKYDLGKVSLSPAHTAVVTALNGTITVELYGTDSGRRMWQGNLCDLIGRKIDEFEKTAMEKDGEKGAPAQEDAQNLLSLFPSPDIDYDDGAIAKVNYFSNVYSSRKKTPSEIAFEQMRLAELGDNLIRARLNVDSLCDSENKEQDCLPPQMDERMHTDERAQSATAANRESAARLSTGAAREEAQQSWGEASLNDEAKEEIVRTEEVEAKTEGGEKELSPFARYIYSFRNELIERQKMQEADCASSMPADRETLVVKQETERESEPSSEAAAALSGSDCVEAVIKGGPAALVQSESREGGRGESKEQAAADNEQQESPLSDSSASDDDEDVPAAPKADFNKSSQQLREAKPEKLNFYERVKSQLDRLFESNPKDAALEKLLPSSTFVRVAVDNSDKYYCVGIIGKPDYICYAVPALYTPQPPEELDGYCQWLPLSPDVPNGNGYWLIYQDAVTGDSVN